MHGLGRKNASILTLLYMFRRMSRIFPVLLMVFWSLCACDSSESQGEPDLLYGFPSVAAPATVPDAVAEAYAEDAAQLAFEIVREVDRDAASVVLPEALQETFFNALGHVWHVTGIPERDSVVVHYGIHPYPTYSLHDVVVGVHLSAPWVQSWIDGDALTGEPSIDRITQAWDLTLAERLDPFCSLCYVILHTEQPINTLALAVEFTDIEGVRYAEPSALAGAGDSIDVTSLDDAVELVYSKGFGDCPAGCINRRYWRFRVAVDGSVEFLESYGSPLP